MIGVMVEPKVKENWVKQEEGQTLSKRILCSVQDESGTVSIMI